MSGPQGRAARLSGRLPGVWALGLRGLCMGGKAPVPGDLLHGGDIGYHLRAGTHYLSREGLAKFTAYMDSHKN